MDSKINFLQDSKHSRANVCASSSPRWVLKVYLMVFVATCVLVSTEECTLRRAGTLPLRGFSSSKCFVAVTKVRANAKSLGLSNELFNGHPL